MLIGDWGVKNYRVRTYNLFLSSTMTFPANYKEKGQRSLPPPNCAQAKT